MVKGFILTLGLFLLGIVASVGVILLIGTEDIAKAIENLNVTLLIPVGVLLCIEACISTFRWKYILGFFRAKKYRLETCSPFGSLGMRLIT